jgi:hypothetical protein
MKTLGINSAKGAVIISSLGQRPRISSIAQLSALKARLIPAIFRTLGAHRPLESRFQRWFTSRLESWGDAPGLDEGAPSALSNSSDRAFES